jgi:hypothetical protein
MWSAPVLHRLLISVPTHSHHITAEHVCSWLCLRFALEHLAGKLRLLLPLHKEEVVLPVCGRFTAITLASMDYIERLPLRFLMRPAGGTRVHGAGRLTIKYARIESCELEELVVSSRCPRLKELVLENIIL